jgi:hypothetical protein
LYGEGIKVSLAKYIGIVERVAPGGPDDRGFGNPASGDSQQDLGDGFIATSVDVGGFTVKAVLDTTTNTYITSNTKPDGGGAIIRNMAPFIIVRNGKIDLAMSVGPKTQEALKKAGILQGGVQETYESSEQVRSIVQRMMEDARVPQKPRQGPLRPQTGAGKHKDKKKDQKQGKEKHKKPFMEQGNTTQRYQAGPIDMQVTKDPKGNVVGNNSTYRVSRDATMKIQKPVGSQITTTTGQANTPDAQKDVDDLLSPQGVAQRRKLDPAQFAKFQQGVAEADYSPMTKDSMKADKIRSLKNLIAKYKEQGRQLKVQELELELKKLQGVAETSDYFRRREREEAIISGQKPARKKQPAQTSDYARRREQEKKSEKGVAEGSGKNVVKSVKVGNFRHDLVDTGFGWQVRIYNGDELYDTGLSKNSEQKGLAALDDAVAYTKKQLNIKEQGVAEGSQPPVCKHCGKRQGEHQRGKCPKGTKTAVGYTDYGPTKFEPKEPKQQGVAEGVEKTIWVKPSSNHTLIVVKSSSPDIEAGEEYDEGDLNNYANEFGYEIKDQGVAEGGWDGTRGWEKRNPLGSDRLPQDPMDRIDRMRSQEDNLKQKYINMLLKRHKDWERSDLELASLPELIKMLRGDLDEAIKRDLTLPDSYYLQLSSGAKSDLKNLYIDHILESVSGVKKDTLETVSYPELKNIVRMIEEKQKGVDGKACWKGYKRMGTKKKGRRTVDNCVKAESLQEKSPPGFKGTVKAMKKHPELTKGKTKDGKEKNPWALAWHMKNKGYKSHKKADGSDKD